MRVRFWYSSGRDCEHCYQALGQGGCRGRDGGQDGMCKRGVPVSLPDHRRMGSSRLHLTRASLKYRIISYHPVFRQDSAPLEVGRCIVRNRPFQYTQLTWQPLAGYRCPAIQHEVCGSCLITISTPVNATRSAAVL